MLAELTLRTMTVNRDTMLDHARRNFCTVTELANYLVHYDGISFRQAHETIATVVGNMVDRKLTCADIDVAAINEVAVKEFGFETKMTQALIDEALDPRRIAEAKKPIGGTAKEEVSRQLDEIEAQIAADRAQCEARRAQIAAAKAELAELSAQVVA